MVTNPTNQISRTGKRLIGTLQVPKLLMARWGGGRWRLVMGHHSNHFDQSDFEDKKTRNLNLRMTKTSAGLIEGISVMMNLIGQFSRIGKHLIWIRAWTSTSTYTSRHVRVLVLVLEILYLQLYFHPVLVLVLEKSTCAWFASFIKDVNKLPPRIFCLQYHTVN